MTNKICISVEQAGVVKTEQGEELVQVIFKPQYMSFTEYVGLLSVLKSHHNAASVEISEKK